MKIYTFDEYLREEHAKDYQGTDDDMPDAFDAWVDKLDGNEIMEYAECAMLGLSRRVDAGLKLAGEAVEELQKVRDMVVKIK